MELSDTVKQKALAGVVTVFILGMGSYWVLGTGNSEQEKVQVAIGNVERPPRAASVVEPITKPTRSRHLNVAVAEDKPSRPHRPTAVRDQKERGKRRVIEKIRKEKVKPQPMG